VANPTMRNISPSRQAREISRIREGPREDSSTITPEAEVSFAAKPFRRRKRLPMLP